MRSIKANAVKPGMVLQMMVWHKPNDRRAQVVTVQSVSGEKKSIAIDLKDHNGNLFSVAHNGDYVALEGPERFRVTFQYEPEANALYEITKLGAYMLADHNGETAKWNHLGDGVWQLPDDGACDSKHNVGELALSGYTPA